jgi:DNA repair exonuclease SbcCD ATPase subunit
MNEIKNSGVVIPSIEQIRLRDFSLFPANPNATIDWTRGVVCLVGANGIGKSTLLAAVNFCLTGTVTDPKRNFTSMEEYYQHTRGFSKSYFRGRIFASREQSAEIHLSFKVGANRYEIERGIFEPEELRAFSRLDSRGNVLSSGNECDSRRAVHASYTQHLVADTGVATFEEFVFLQHFVFTFDERRQTLLWNQNILERALYRAFGLDPNMARSIDLLRKAREEEDSKVRNRQFEATRLRRRLRELIQERDDQAQAQSTLEHLTIQEDTLAAAFSEASDAFEQAATASRDETLRLSTLLMREASLKEEYARSFDEAMRSGPVGVRHPIMTRSLSDHACAFCGTSDDQAIAVLMAKASTDHCPLCDAKLTREESDPNDDPELLKQIDEQLAAVRATISEVTTGVNNLQRDEAAARERYENVRAKVDEFERQNRETIDRLRPIANGTNTLTEDIYREQLRDLDQEKTIAQSKRDEHKRDILKLQKELAEQYRIAEEEFVPRFRELAMHFLGMPVHVDLDTRSGGDVRLVVSVKGTTRRYEHNLSESQRFFLDIALRMALIEQIVCSPGVGSIYIDTPEGSLDIAYEKRAGDMLAMFAQKGNKVLMTANLNSSQLLLALAGRCGRSAMALYRMTDWAELSAVQKEEEALFTKAFDEIDSALSGV